jgi:flavorubredoxin
MARIDEITDGIYRISTTVDVDGGAFQFNQFLVDDERPALIHTGMYGMYEAVRDAVGEVVDPGKLGYVILLHFESDECGGMDRFLEGAPRSTLACSELSNALNLSGWNFGGRVEGHVDGDVIDLGRHKLRFLETPHVHHWDSMMIFEETTRSVFPADLYMHPGQQPPVVDEDLTGPMLELYRESGIFAHEQPVRAVIDRLEALDPDWMHTMHGGTLTREILPRYTRAFREQPFAYQGRLIGREVVAPDDVVPGMGVPPAATESVPADGS